MARLDHPLVFALVMTLIVLGMAHLLHMGAKAAKQDGLAAFFSLNN